MIFLDLDGFRKRGVATPAERSAWRQGSLTVFAYELGCHSQALARIFLCCKEIVLTFRAFPSGKPRLSLQPRAFKAAWVSSSLDWL